MGVIVAWMDEAFYSGVGKNWDDDLLRQKVLEVLRSDHSMLDLGAGSGIVSEMNFKHHVAYACGLDPDPRVKTNPHLHEGCQGFGESIPWPDNSFDVVVSNNVFEHLEHPEVVLTEIKRVLKPGGMILAKTPNKYHYMPLIARLTPHRFHQFYNKLRGRETVDTFPTFYRANTPKDIARQAEGLDLEFAEFILTEGRPEYLRLSFITYIPGLLYERIVSTLYFLRHFRVSLIVKLRKPEE